MREEPTWAMERRRRLARGFHPGPLFPGGLGLSVHKVLLARARSHDGTGRLPLPAPPGGRPAPCLHLRHCCRPLSARLGCFLAGELHGTRAVSLHQAPSISPEGPWRESGGSLQAIGYNFLLIIRAKGRRRGEQRCFQFLLPPQPFPSPSG